MGSLKTLAHHRVSRLTVALCVLPACLMVGFGCSQAPSAKKDAVSEQTFAGEYPIKSTVTVGMVADLVRAIGGQHVQVTQLMGAGVDPHLYKPTRDDSAAIMSADIVFYNGLMLEGKMSELLGRIGATKPTFAVAESLSAAQISSPHQSAATAATQDESAQNIGHADPHVWMDVSLWNQVAAAVGDELSRFDPQHAEDYRNATRELQSQLESLHKYGVDVIGCIPEEQKVLVTSHDAFRYFGAAYGVEVQAVQGISTESEAGLSRINQLVDLLVARKVQAVFVESSVPKESIQALLRGAASKGQQVEIGGSLFSDAMGNEGTYEGTYIGMMDHNLTTIARALGCDRVPENGFQSRIQP